jgi:hypothetical protein
LNLIPSIQLYPVLPGNSSEVYLSIFDRDSRPSLPRIKMGSQTSIQPEPDGLKAWVYTHWLALNLILSLVTLIFIYILYTNPSSTQIPNVFEKNPLKYRIFYFAFYLLYNRKLARMTDSQSSKSPIPSYLGYFFSLLAQNMPAYLDLLGRDLKTQQHYLHDQLRRIVTEKENRQQIADATIAYMAGGSAKQEVQTLLSLARWLAANVAFRKFFWSFRGEDEDDFLEQSALKALDALPPRHSRDLFLREKSYESNISGERLSGSEFEEIMGRRKFNPLSDDDAPSTDGDAPNKPPPPTPSKPEQRYLNASTREQVRLDDEFGLTVQVTTTLKSHGPAQQGVPFPNIRGNITINVHGDGVDFLGPSLQTLNIPAKGPSAPLLFRLRAAEPGEHRLEITAWNGAAHIAGITLTIRIDAAPVPADHPPVSGSAIITQTAPVILRDPAPGEYALEIVYDKSKEAYRFRLVGEDLSGDGIIATCDPLTDNRRTQYQGLRDSLSAQARNENRYTPLQQSIWLKGFGTTFAECLVPPVIRTTLLRIRDKIRQITIMNDGDDLPWELLYIDAPPDTDEKGFFIADLHGACRWWYGAPPPAKITASPLILVHPDGSPEHTATEISQLLQLFPTAKVIRNMDELLTLIGKPAFGSMHFAADNHEATGYSGGSYIPFGQSRFDQTLFTGAVGVNAYRSSQPLVFMNGCTTAGAASLFTEMFSWADRYIRSGAGSFIGSLWEIADQSAPVFALAFYRELKAGSTLGEAMHAGREAVRAVDPGDPTRLAYTLYGNPQAKVEYV